MSKKRPNDGFHRAERVGESALHVYIPADLHYRFAVLCVQKSKPQKDIIIEFMEEWLKENEQKKEAKGVGNKKSG